MVKIKQEKARQQEEDSETKNVSESFLDISEIPS